MARNALRDCTRAYPASTGPPTHPREYSHAQSARVDVLVGGGYRL